MIEIYDHEITNNDMNDIEMIIKINYTFNGKSFDAIVKTYSKYKPKHIGEIQLIKFTNIKENQSISISDLDFELNESIRSRILQYMKQKFIY